MESDCATMGVSVYNWSHVFLADLITQCPHILTEINHATKLKGLDADKSRPLIQRNFKVVNLNRSMFVVLII
jgi:hypothetical protein